MNKILKSFISLTFFQHLLDPNFGFHFLNRVPQATYISDIIASYLVFWKKLIAHLPFYRIDLGVYFRLRLAIALFCTTIPLKSSPLFHL